jgi:putative ABC transport system substrate-binding protein
VKRREFITLLGGVAAAWPMAARAQQTTLAIGFLSPGSPEPSSFLLEAFREGLKEASYFEGKNVTIEYRWARGHYDELQALAADLVGRGVAAIAATGGTISAQAARAATSTIPIVFNVGDDPIKSGLVASFNRPGGNITGVNTMSPALETKRLGLLRELVPSPGMIAVLLNAANPDVGIQLQDINAAATFTNQRQQIVALAAHHAVPTMYAFRQFAESGGLMSYSTNLVEVYRQVGVYTGRVLKGENPANLPVVQPTKFELVINLNTAKALGLEVPATLLARADEVIE